MPWTALAPLPSKRANNNAALDLSNRVYNITGSLTLSSGPLSLFERYDPTTNVWTNLTAVPSPARLAVGAATDFSGRIYVIGGSLNQFGTSVSAQVDRYNPATETWATIAPLPQERYSAPVAVDFSGRIYVIGGIRNSGFTNSTVYRFDPGTGAWSSVAPLAFSVWGDAQAAVTDSSGRILFVNAAGTTMQRYDPSTNAWTTLAPPYPSGSSETMDALISDGAGKFIAFRRFGTDLYDPATNTWTLSPDPLVLSTGHNGAVMRDLLGRIYVVGGETDSEQVTARVDRYEDAVVDAGWLVGSIGFS